MRPGSFLLDLLFPPKCMLCHEIMSSSERKICPRCASELPVLSAKEQKQSFNHVSLCSSLFYYEGSVRESLLRYKFKGLQYYASEYARLMAENIPAEALDCDVISFTPLSRRRLRRRGYDQARLLAEELAAITGKECRPTLRKVRDVAPQSGTGGLEERRANISNAYRIRKDADINGKTVLLADDIVTTGSTLSECAGVLVRAGAADVKAVTVARRKTNY